MVMNAMKVLVKMRFPKMKIIEKNHAHQRVIIAITIANAVMIVIVLIITIIEIHIIVIVVDLEAPSIFLILAEETTILQT